MTSDTTQWVERHQLAKLSFAYPKLLLAVFCVGTTLLATPAMADVWHGWFEQQGQRFQFSAQLNSSRESYLRGTTEEYDNVPGTRGQRLLGELIGERRGRVWYWSKRYQNTNREQIEYIGVVSPDGYEIVGWWNISNMAQGQFSMRRR